MFSNSCYPKHFYLLKKVPILFWIAPSDLKIIVRFKYYWKNNWEKKVLYFIKWDSDIEKDYWKTRRCELNMISPYVISIRKNGWKTHYPILSHNKIIKCIEPNSCSNEYYKFWLMDTQRDGPCSIITKMHEDSTILNGTFFSLSLSSWVRLSEILLFHYRFKSKKANLYEAMCGAVTTLSPQKD